MKLSQALVELYLALIKDGVLILDLIAAPDNYNAPVSKAASLMDNYTFYRFSKICELFVNGKDIREIACIFHNTRSGNTKVDIFLPLTFLIEDYPGRRGSLFCFFIALSSIFVYSIYHG